MPISSDVFIKGLKGCNLFLDAVQMCIKQFYQAAA